MRPQNLNILLVLLPLLCSANDGARLRFKKSVEPQPAAAVHRQVKSLTPGSSHLVLEFDAVPDAALLRQLRGGGFIPVGGVPERGILVRARDGATPRASGLRRAFHLRSEDKLSERLGQTERTTVVEFHADIEPWEAQSIALREGLQIREHPDLKRNHLLVTGARTALEALAGWDEVAYIFPASARLQRLEPVTACAGALSAGGPVAQYTASVGPGWDGYGPGSAILTYSYQRLSSALPDDIVKREIERAMEEWEKHVQVSFRTGGYPAARRNVNYMFATGNYGTGYPFDGRGGVLARTYYPSPPNPEPVAGDVHFDDDEPWNVGVRIDLFSVALHELGHALGLAHSDDPLDVMYPYYRTATELSPGDIASIRMLYATASDDQPQSSPLALSIDAPLHNSETTASFSAVSGTATGGTAPLVLGWRTNLGLAGSITVQEGTWTVPSVPLGYGTNIISCTVKDAGGQQLIRSITVNRVTPAPPAPVPEPEPEPEPATPPPATPPAPAPAPTPAPAPPSQPPPTGDRTNPALTLQYPAGPSVSTTADTIVIRGSARDNVGVTAVRWATNTGLGGQANGTSFWQTAPIKLNRGSTLITLKAYDAAGNYGWRSVIVTRR